MDLKECEILKVENKNIEWQGPFSWPGYENQNGIDKIMDIDGIYLWTFQYKSGFSSTMVLLQLIRKMSEFIIQ